MYMKLENGNSESRSILPLVWRVMYYENDCFCLKCGDNRRPTLDREGDKRLQGRLQRF